MKPKMFIGSSVEQLELAYAAQEGLEHNAEITVWTQGIFEPSKTTMASLIDVLDDCDFGLFILAPDDITKIRDNSQHTVRDNVIFELGLFVGRLGNDRCFMIIPRGIGDLHLPSDLLGLTPATFEADRQDKNLVASLGPACNRIRKAITKLGPIARPLPNTESVATIHAPSLYSDENDCIILIESWLGRRPASENRAAIRYDDVDRELGLAPGAARLYLEQAAKRWRYVTARKGKDMILLESSTEDI